MFLFNRGQEANERYTTKFITALYEEEAKGVFITRESVLGHLQQVIKFLDPYHNIIQTVCRENTTRWLLNYLITKIMS